MKVKYIGETSKLTMINGKVYDARDCGRGWFALIDETNEEYAYPPRLFEVVEDSENKSPEKPTKINAPPVNKKSTVNIAASGK